MTERLSLVFAALIERRLSVGAIKHLLEHPRNEQLQMEGSCFYFARPQPPDQQQQGWIALKGLTSLLRDFYWPGCKWGGKTVNKPEARAKTTKTWVPPMMSAKGRVRGSIVHRQLGEYVNLGRKQFLAQNRHVHPLVRQALRTLEASSLYPVQAEYKVAQVDVRLGSAIDLLCVNMHTGTPTFVEVKTSARRSLFEQVSPGKEYDGLLGKIRPPLLFSDCARAKVQLGVTLLMAIEGTGFAGRFDAFVMLLADDQAQGFLYAVPESILRTYAVPAYKDIQMRLPLWRAENKSKK